MTVIGLYVRQQDWMTGREYREPIIRDRCWKCYEPAPDLAHTVFEYVIAVIATELDRRVAAAIAEHEAEHGCARPGWWNGCPDVEALWDLLPDYMKPVAIA